MSQMSIFLPLPPPLCYNDIVGTAEKTRFFLPRSPTDPIPRKQKMERPEARCAKQRASGHFPAKSKPKPKGPAAQSGRPRFCPILTARTAPPPAHLCRSAGLRPAGQTVLRTVLGGGLRPPPTAAPGAAGPAGLPSALPCRPPAPPRQRARRITRQAPFLPHPHRPNGTAARSASTNCASAGLAVSCRQTAMTSSFSSAPVSGMNTRFSAGEYLRAE